MLHGDGLRKFPQHPLLKVLEPLVVVAAADKLLVLQGVEGEAGRGDVEVRRVSLMKSCSLQASSQAEASIGLSGKFSVGKLGSRIHPERENAFVSAASLTRCCADMSLLLKVKFCFLLYSINQQI